MGISVVARFHRRVLRANSLGECSTAMEDVARDCTPLHPNFLAEFGSHAAQFLEPLSDPLHDLLIRCGLAGAQKAITNALAALCWPSRPLRLSGIPSSERR